MASTKMAETRNFGTYDKKDLKTLSGRTDERGTTEQPYRKTNCTKNLKNKLEKSTKFENLKQEAHVAQRSREEREDERRKRIDELRMRNNDRRNRVEERKRLIFEAEREKQLAILRKNQEIEARIEARRNKEKEEKRNKNKKKNEKLNTPVAFGSTTPRMLCLNDTNGSFCSSCMAMAKEHDGDKKKESSIIVGGHGKKFNEERRSVFSKSFNHRTTNNKRNEQQQIRGIQTPRRSPAMSQSMYVSSLKVFTPLSVTSYGEMTPSSRSRSNSSMSHRSSSTTGSMDSCNVKLSPRPVVNRQRRPPIVDSNVSVPVKPNHLSRDSKLTAIKPSLSKLHGTPKGSSTPKPSEIKKRLMAEASRAKEQEQRLIEETMRLANEMMEMEKEKLRNAIEKTKRCDEEEQRKRDEQARKKREKEETEKTIEQLERQRIEFFERLKKSEEERLARRKRVEIIMLRTRG